MQVSVFDMWIGHHCRPTVASAPIVHRPTPTPADRCLPLLSYLVGMVGMRFNTTLSECLYQCIVHSAHCIQIQFGVKKFFPISMLAGVHRVF